MSEKIDLMSTISLVKSWALAVGEFQNIHFRSNNLEISTKTNPADMVTNIDHASEKMLIDRITEHFPTHAILSEEVGEKPANSPYRWVLDPLDGTTNYIMGLPNFCVSIGLEYEGETVLGVVFAPYLGELYWAVSGHGAYLWDKRLSVGRKTAIRDGVFVTGFPYDKASNSRNNVSIFTKVATQARGVRRLGAAAYDLCAVAAGFVDGYWEYRLSPWDLSAGRVIVSEAGGEVRQLKEGFKTTVVASNRTLSKRLYELLI